MRLNGHFAPAPQAWGFAPAGMLEYWKSGMLG